MKKFLLILFTCLYSIKSLQNNPVYRCNYDGFKNKINFANITVKSNNPNKIFKLNEDGFKDFNIFLDLFNFDYEIQKYGLSEKRDFFANGLIKAKTTLEKLLKVKQIDNYVFVDEQLMTMNITKWDTTKIGSEAIKQNKGMRDLGIDLYLFISFGDKQEMGERILASAGPSYVDPITWQPVTGFVKINREVDYSKNNSLRYLEGILVHELTHVLGFGNHYFDNVMKSCYQATDSNGVQKYYINSTRVLDTAKKYFNCDTMKGVALEEYGVNGTVDSHWDARILLGEYMNSVIYPEEQVISEFTLALLEDLGYYKANYYTGGLLKYGKNKGCNFVNDRCINNGIINQEFLNEFFSNIQSGDTFADPSCSSGRQSRTYHRLLRYSKRIPENYQYFTNPYIGGLATADYCPVSVEDNHEAQAIYHVGHCSEIGSGNYGSQISYSNYGSKDKYKNSELQKYTGESYSNNSF